MPTDPQSRQNYGPQQPQSKPMQGPQPPRDPLPAIAYAEGFAPNDPRSPANIVDLLFSSSPRALNPFAFGNSSAVSNFKLLMSSISAEQRADLIVFLFSHLVRLGERSRITAGASPKIGEWMVDPAAVKMLASASASALSSFGAAAQKFHSEHTSAQPPATQGFKAPWQFDFLPDKSSINEMVPAQFMPQVLAGTVKSVLALLERTGLFDNETTVNFVRWFLIAAYRDKDKNGAEALADSEYDGLPVRQTDIRKAVVALITGDMAKLEWEKQLLAKRRTAAKGTLKHAMRLVDRSLGTKQGDQKREVVKSYLSLIDNGNNAISQAMIEGAVRKARSASGLRSLQAGALRKKAFRYASESDKAAALRVFRQAVQLLPFLLEEWLRARENLKSSVKAKGPFTLFGREPIPILTANDRIKTAFGVKSANYLFSGNGREMLNDFIKRQSGTDIFVSPIENEGEIIGKHLTDDAMNAFGSERPDKTVRPDRTLKPSPQAATEAFVNEPQKNYIMDWIGDASASRKRGFGEKRLFEMEPAEAISALLSKSAEIMTLVGDFVDATAKAQVQQFYAPLNALTNTIIGAYYGVPVENDPIELSDYPYAEKAIGVVSGQISGPFHLASTVLKLEQLAIEDPAKATEELKRMLISSIQSHDPFEPGISGPERYERALNLLLLLKGGAASARKIGKTQFADEMSKMTGASDAYLNRVYERIVIGEKNIARELKVRKHTTITTGSPRLASKFSEISSSQLRSRSDKLKTTSTRILRNGKQTTQVKIIHEAIVESSEYYMSLSKTNPALRGAVRSPRIKIEVIEELSQEIKRRETTLTYTTQPPTHKRPIIDALKDVSTVAIKEILQLMKGAVQPLEDENKSEVEALKQAPSPRIPMQLKLSEAKRVFDTLGVADQHKELYESLMFMLLLDTRDGKANPVSTVHDLKTVMDGAKSGRFVVPGYAIQIVQEMLMSDSGLDLLEQLRDSFRNGGIDAQGVLEYFSQIRTA